MKGRAAADLYMVSVKFPSPSLTLAATPPTGTKGSPALSPNAAAVRLRGAVETKYQSAPNGCL